MTSTPQRIETVALNAAARPESISQSTRVEQARAVAEVQAAIIVAQQCPRSMPTALSLMRESCQQPALANRAFWRFPRSGEVLTGPSIHLARELARCWGNVQYGITELRRDDANHYSEMLAFAWDVQTNSRSSTGFVVPHKRDTKRGVVDLTDLRDIYESNANMGARRVREMIFAIIPTWYTEEAKELCAHTIEHPPNDTRSLPQRVADAVSKFEGIGVSDTQLAAKVGRAVEKWTAHDLAALAVIFGSIRNGEMTVADEFGTWADTEPTGAARPVKLDEIQASKPAKDKPADEPPAEPEPEPVAMRSDAQSRRIHAQLNKLGMGQRDQGLLLISNLLGRNVPTSKDLTFTDAEILIRELDSMTADEAAIVIGQAPPAGWPAVTPPGEPE